MKSFFRAGLFLLLALGWVASAGSTIRYVDSNGGVNHYMSINAAYSDASIGDTLVIASSTYNENLIIAKRLTFIGSGIDITIVNGTVVFSSGSSGTEITGLSIISSAVNHDGVVTLQSEVDSISIIRCRLQANGSGGRDTYGAIVDRNGVGRLLVIDGCILKQTSSFYHTNQRILRVNGDNVIIRNTIFAGSNSGGLDVGFAGVTGTASYMVINNCVFTALGVLFDLSGTFPFMFTNNICLDWTTTPAWGAYPLAGTIEYNASSGALPPGSNGVLLSTNPFIGYDTQSNYQYETSNLHLDPTNGLTCIDAGHPNLVDLDGSRSDLGVYGGLTPFSDTGAPAYPFVSQLAVPSAITAGQPLPVSSTGRIGREY